MAGPAAARGVLGHRTSADRQFQVTRSYGRRAGVKQGRTGHSGPVCRSDPGSVGPSRAGVRIGKWAGIAAAGPEPSGVVGPETPGENMPVLLDAAGGPVALTSVRGHRDARVLTIDRGIWLEFSDGAVYGLTVSVSHRPTEPGTARPARRRHARPRRNPGADARLAGARYARSQPRRRPQATKPAGSRTDPARLTPADRSLSASAS
jgi:hypothetical protein